MGIVHEFEHQNRRCWRRELDGYPVRVSVKQRVTPWNGKDYPTTEIRWRGLHRVFDGKNVWLASESLTTDAGPKLGTALVFDQLPESPATQEEIQRNRQNLNGVLRQICPGVCVTDWGDGAEREAYYVEEAKKIPPLAV